MSPHVRCSSRSRRAFSRGVRVTLVFFMLLSLGNGWAAALQGTATCRDGCTFAADAVFEAVLQDSSRAGAPAIILGQSRMTVPAQAPISFRIPYDEAAVQPGRRYTVRAVIRRSGQLLFTTDRIYPVLDGRNQALQIELIAVPVRP